MTVLGQKDIESILMILQEMSPMDLIFRHFQSIVNIPMLSLSMVLFSTIGYNAQISLTGHLGIEQYQVCIQFSTVK
jgi:hypothetical protein